MLAQYSNTTNGTSGGGLAVLFAFYTVIIVLEIIGIWKVFAKAGQPGWAAIIPFYNTYVMIKIAGHPGWWLVLFFIPLVNIIVWFIVSIDVARSFAKSTGFGVGLALLGFVFWPILGFGDARYVGPAGTPGTGPGSMAPPPPPMPVS
jgi:Family of unknown function (DUF5684)